ncbi:hypothetical protein P4O66_005840, partial [Electrophorus voltai]
GRNQVGGHHLVQALCYLGSMLSCHRNIFLDLLLPPATMKITLVTIAVAMLLMDVCADIQPQKNFDLKRTGKIVVECDIVSERGNIVVECDTVSERGNIVVECDTVSERGNIVVECDTVSERGNIVVECDTVSERGNIVVECDTVSERGNIVVESSDCKSKLYTYKKTAVAGVFTYFSSRHNRVKDITVIETNYTEYALIFKHKKFNKEYSQVSLYGRTQKLRPELTEKFKKFAKQHGFPEDFILTPTPAAVCEC